MMRVPSYSPPLSIICANTDEIGGGAEQSSVAGDATERVGVLVVHLAAERIAARRRDFGRRDAGAERVGWAEERVVHAERVRTRAPGGTDRAARPTAASTTKPSMSAPRSEYS